MEKEEVKSDTSKRIFTDLTADNDAPTEIESLCMNCGKNGITRLLLTRIPHYKDVVVMSFDCEFCGYQNNEIQSGGKYQEKGVKITLKIETPKDMNRQVVKSDYTSILIPVLDFEIPARSQKGEITTVEGIIERSITGLQQDQDKRRKDYPTAAEQIDEFIEKLTKLKEFEEPFNMIIEDISGECYVENPNAPLKDKACEITYFRRTKEQNEMLGIFEENENNLLHPVKEGEFSYEDIQGEVHSFHTNCPECNNMCETNMKLTNIPHFKEVVIMATVCEHCGHKTNEVKSGGGIESKGVKIEVIVTGKEDFSRDLLKSETCHMSIPELELEVGPTTLGGRFTTVEGIISAVKEQLSSSLTLTGDSANPETANRMETFVNQISQILEGKLMVTLVLDDPAGNSYVQNLADDGLDDRLTITKYDRTFEQNEELGLNDMRVEDY